MTAPSGYLRGDAQENGLVRLEFAGELDADHPPLVSSFSLTNVGDPVDILSLSVDPVAGTITLVTAETWNMMDIGLMLMIEYFDPTGGDDASAIQDPGGQDFDAFTDSPGVQPYCVWRRWRCSTPTASP